MKSFLLFFSLLPTSNLVAQATNFSRPWKGHDCAVVLTYDDGLNVHLSNAIPALDSVKLKGTFYLSDYFGGLRSQIPKWRKAAAEGHELANHTIYHPCAGDLPGRSFVTPDNDLNRYTIRRLTDEIKTMNTLLHAIDGKTQRSFAFPCGDMKLHDTAYALGLKNEFLAARSVRPEMLPLEKVNLFDVGCYMVNGETGDQLIGLVKKAMASKTLLVFLFHGVGGEHSLNVSLQAHHELLRFLASHRKEIWIAPMLDVAKYINQEQNHSTHN